MAADTDTSSIKRGPTWTLSDDRKTVTVAFPSDPPVALQLDAAGVDDILTNLGHMRGAMLPEFPREYAMRQKCQAIPDPIWVTEPDALHQYSVFRLRDPRYGWLHYAFPLHEANKLGQFLQTQAQNQPLAPSKDKAN